MLFGALGQFALGQFDEAPSAAVLIATPGAYAITGQAATFNARIIVTAGSYTINGSAAAFATRMVASAGSYAITGQAASFNPKLIAVAGAYAITGQSATFATRMPITAGAYTLSGQAATFNPKEIVAAGAYTVTGVAITFKMRMVCSPGAYTITGNAAPYFETIRGAGGWTKKHYRGKLEIARRQIIITDDEGRTRRVDLLRHLKPPPPFAPAPDWVLPQVAGLPPALAEAMPLVLPAELFAHDLVRKPVPTFRDHARLPDSLIALQDARDENDLVELLTNSPDPLVEDLRHVLSLLHASGELERLLENA